MSELITSDYYYGLEAEQYTFFRIPKILFSPTYKTLSVSAKMLYALMLDRMSLSARNRWMDEDGRVFIYFRMSEIMSALGCGHNKAIAPVCRIGEGRSYRAQEARHGQTC